MESYFQNKHVLVTGACGFLGSHLTQTALSMGALVYGIDNFLTGRKENTAEYSANPHFTLLEADVITDPRRYLPKGVVFDLVLHFASPASPPRYQAHPVETYLVNTVGTHNLLQYLKETAPTARFLFASTSEVYGDPAIHPQVEGYWGNVNPNGIRSCYDEAKRLGETICGVHARDFGMDARIVRIFNTYGPRIDPVDGRVIPQFISEGLAGIPYSIFGDGSQTRSYCYVSDLVAGILRYAATDGLAGETINIGNPEERTVLETAQIIHELLHLGIAFQAQFKPLPKDDPIRRKPDISKAIKLLDWQPNVGFKEGIERTIKFLRD